MNDLNELARKYQDHGESHARIAYEGARHVRRDVAEHAANCLTIAAHLRDAAEREKAEAARDHYATRFADRVFGKSVTQQMQESIDAITAGGPTLARPLEDYAPGNEAAPPAAPTEGSKITLEATILAASQHSMKLAFGETRLWLLNTDLDAARVKDEEKQDGAAVSPPVSSRAPAPARLRDELAGIVDNYMANDETDDATVDRILDALIESGGHSLELRYAQDFLEAVKEGRV